MMNKSKNISWMPLFVIAAAAFIGAPDATFMNVAMSDEGSGLSGHFSSASGPKLSGRSSSSVMSL